MTNNILKMGLLIVALLISNLSFGGTFKVNDRAEGISKNEASCSSAEKYATYKALEQCERVGIATSKRASDWTRSEGSYWVRGHNYDFGYTEYYCDVEAEFECTKEIAERE